MIRFSIVIPFYNQGPFLAESLGSVRAQTLAPHEIIIVDDGSTDPFARQRLEELRGDDVKIVRQDNRGLPGARNTGIQHSTGEWIIPLDSDDQLLPSALQRYAAAISNAPEVDIWYPDVEHFGLQKDVWPAPEFDAWRMLHMNLMICSSAINRRVFDAGVFYNERMRGGYEDWEFYIHACCEREFVAKTLKQPVFRYRRWGFSMLSESEQRSVELREQIKRERVVYQDQEKLTRFKRRGSPFFAIAAQGPRLSDALAGQELQDCRVVDESDRVARDGDLSLFQDHPGRTLLISFDDDALAAALRDDVYLLEKLARNIEVRKPAAIWLVTSKTAGAAYPGILLPFSAQPAEHAERCVGLIVTLEQLFAHPNIPRTDGTLFQDLVDYLQATATETTRYCMIGHADAKAGHPLPEPDPDARGLSLSAAEIGKRISRATRALIGGETHDRIWQAGPLIMLRDWLEPLDEEEVQPPSHSVRPGPIPRRFGLRERDGRWWIALDAARHTPCRPTDDPALVIALPWIVHGGAERATVDFLHALSRIAPDLRRYVVTTMSSTLEWADQVLPHVDGVFSLADMSDEEPSEAFADLLERLGARALLAVNSQAAYDALPTIRKRRLPMRVVSQLHGFTFDPKTNKPQGYPVYAASRYNNLIDAYAPISQYISDRLASEFYVSPTKLRTIRLGIDVDWYSQARAERFRPGQRATVLWIGRLSSEKDPEMLLRVAQAWKAKHGSSRLGFVVVGGGELEGRMREMLFGDHLEDIVTLAGSTDTPLPFYRGADCLMLTSKYEGIPVVVYEAMAAGLPVITPTRNTAIPEVLAPSEAQFISNQSDPAEYVRALERLIEAPDETRRISLRMAELSAQYRSDRYAKDLLSLLFESS